MDVNRDGMGGGAGREPEKTELERVSSVRDSRVRLRRFGREAGAGSKRHT